MVSWNDAADSHESVASDALVMPMISGRPSAGFLPSVDERPVGVGVGLLVDALTREEGGVSRLVHGDATGHLPHDELDVLVVDRDALVAVHLLDLVHEVLLGLADALDLDELLGIAGTVDDGVTGADLVAIGDLEAGDAGNEVRVLGAVVGDDRDRASLALVLADADDTGRAGEGGLALRGTGLEELDDAGQTAGDVAYRRCRRCGRSAS